MIEFYPQIKAVHVIAVIASGSLFLVRGVAVQSGAVWAMTAPWRYLSYTIDTILLGAALVLVAILPVAIWASGWLAAKIVLLVVYIVLGSFALKRARMARTRLLCFVLALVVFACMFAIARAHHPLAPILPLID